MRALLTSRTVSKVLGTKYDDMSSKRHVSSITKAPTYMSSFNFRYRNAKKRTHLQKVVCTDANCVVNAKIKYRYLVLPMRKQKHNQNCSVKYFILCIRFSKISLFRMVLKRLKLHQIFGVHEFFFCTQACRITRYFRKMAKY